MKSEKYYELIDQYRKIHSKVRYGQVSSNRQDDVVKHVDFEVNSILDYGCGRSKLADNVAKLLVVEEVHKYDPAIPEHSDDLPAKVDLLLCTDVLEHIPENDIPEFLKDLKKISKNCFFTACLRKANKILPNGDNAHITVKSAYWWTVAVRKVFPQSEATHVCDEWVYIKTWRDDGTP